MLHRRSVPTLALLVSILSLAPAREMDAVGTERKSLGVQSGGHYSAERSTQIVDDLDDWEDISYNCGFAPSPLPSGAGFFKGGPPQNWSDGTVPAGGVRSVWDGHAYWTGARSLWIDQDANNWAIWAPSLPEDGLYRVEAFIPRMGTSGRYDTRRATYRIQTDSDHEWSHEHEFPINQLQTASAGGGWLTLDELFFSNTSLPGGCAGGPTVLLTDVSSDVSSAITVDAMRFVPVDGEQPVEPHPEVTIDGGCDQTFRPFETLRVHYWANVSEYYQLILYREPDFPAPHFGQNHPGVAGTMYTDDLTVSATTQRGRFVLRLADSQIDSASCWYNVSSVPTAVPTPLPTPRPTDTPPPPPPTPTDTPSNLLIREMWWNDHSNPRAFQGNSLHVRIANVGGTRYESGNGQYRLLVTTAVDGQDDALVLHFASLPSDPATWLAPQVLPDLAPGDEIVLTASNIWFTSGGTGGYYSALMELENPDSSERDNGSGVQNLTVEGIPVNAVFRCIGAIAYLIGGAPLSSGLEQFLKPSVKLERVTRKVMDYLREVGPCIKAEDTECILENTPTLLSSFDPDSLLDAVNAIMKIVLGVVEDIGGCLVDAVRIGLELIGRLQGEGLAGDAVAVTGNAFVGLRDDRGRAVGYLAGSVATEVPGSSVYVGDVILAMSPGAATEIVVEASNARSPVILAATVRREGLSTYIEYPLLDMTAGLKGRAQLRDTYALQVDSNGDGRTEFVIEPRIIRRLGSQSVYLPQAARNKMLGDDGADLETPTTTGPTPPQATQTLSPSSTPRVPTPSRPPATVTRRSSATTTRTHTPTTGPSPLPTATATPEVERVEPFFRNSVALGDLEPYNLTTSPTHLFVSGDIPASASSSVLRSFAYNGHLGTFTQSGELRVPRVSRGFLAMAWAADMVFGQEDGISINRISVEDPSAMTYVSSLSNARLSDARETEREVWNLHAGMGLTRLQRQCCRAALVGWSSWRAGQRHLVIYRNAEEATPILALEGEREPRSIAMSLHAVVAQYPGEVEVYDVGGDTIPRPEALTLPPTCANCTLLGARDLVDRGIGVLEGIFVDQQSVVRALELGTGGAGIRERWSVAVGHPVIKMLALDDVIVVVGELPPESNTNYWRSQLTIIGSQYDNGPHGVLGLLDVPLTIRDMKPIGERSFVVLGYDRYNDGTLGANHIVLYGIGSPLMPAK